MDQIGPTAFQRRTSLASRSRGRKGRGEEVKRLRPSVLRFLITAYSKGTIGKGIGERRQAGLIYQGGKKEKGGQSEGWIANKSKDFSTKEVKMKNMKSEDMKGASLRADRDHEKKGKKGFSIPCRNGLGEGGK